MFKMIGLAAAASALSACTVTAPMTERHGDSSINNIAKYDDLTPGQTTVYDIYDVFGQPHEVAHDAGGNGHLWRYYFIEENPTVAAYIPVYGEFAADRKYDIRTSTFWFHANDSLWEHNTESTVRKRQSRVAAMDAVTTQKNITSRVKAEMARLNLKYKGGEAINMAVMIDMTE